MKKINYILMYGDCTKNINWFSDMTQIENFSLHYAKLKGYRRTIFWRIIRKIFNHIKLKNKSKFYNLSNIKINPNEEYYVLMLSDTLMIYDTDMINEFNKNNNVHLSLLLLNSMDASSVSIVKTKDKFKYINFDFIFTFDYRDAQKYNFEYLGLTYYSKPKNIKLDNKQSDIFFVGGFKGNRKEKILEIFNKLKNNQVNCNFNIRLGKKERFINQKFLHKINYYKKWMPYEKVISQVMSSNCILEVLQDNQFGQSLRYFEAVCFNKKLLTNNKNIKNLPFYNEKYMKVFDNINDIDYEWVKRKELIDYEYNNEFSPIFLIQKINEVYKRKFIN